MPVLDGLGAAAGFRRAAPDTAVVDAYDVSEDEYIMGPLDGGASGFLLRPGVRTSCIRRFPSQPKPFAAPPGAGYGGVVRVVAEKSWSWMLFEEDDRRVLTVLCNVSAVYFDVAIELSVDENARYLRDGEPFIEQLAAGIQHSLDAFRHRLLPDFHTYPQARTAAAAWRSAHD